MTKYLRHRKDGTIYPWNEILAENPLVETVTEEQAFPEKFVPPKQAKRKTKLKLETDVPDETEPTTPSELAADAARGLNV